MRINVHIERVVLDGVPVGRYQAPALRHALEAKLRLLLAGVPERTVSSSGISVPVLRTPMPAAGSGDAAGWGEGIAAAVGGAMLP